MRQRVVLALMASVMFAAAPAVADQISPPSGSSVVTATLPIGASRQRQRRAMIPAVRVSGDIPIIPLPDVLRPTRPPANSPL
jgi:hypothetical protein